MACWNQNKKYEVNSPKSYIDNDLNTEFSCNKLGYYSIDAQGNFYNNSKRELRSLISNYESKCGSDLTDGFDPLVQLGHTNLDRPLDSFLYWIVLNKDKISRDGRDRSQAKQLDAEFVFTPGTIKMLLATVFNTGSSYEQPWRMYATKFNGTIYIANEEDIIEAVGPPQEEEEKMKKIIHMGPKFEELISEPSGKQQLEGKPADRKVEGRPGFYSVRRGSLGGHHLVLTRAQVDFINENGEYVECKLSVKYTGRDEWKFPMHKLRDWWYHLYAGDMKEVVYGIRDGPKLERVSRLKKNEIPNQVKNPRMSCPTTIESALKSWNPLASIGFVDDFLQWLKGVVVEGNYEMDGGRVVQYTLEWEKGSSSISYSREEVRMSNFVLPDWYIREMSAFFG